MRHLISLIVILTLFACSHRPPTQEMPTVLSAWTELGPGNAFFARAIVKGACPSITADGKITAMAERAPETESYPRVCEANIDRATSSLTLGSMKLPILPADPKHILVVGDTGCRVVVKKSGYVIQACNDPMQWPFGKLAESATAAQPDLVIHVGDYHYRESECPASHPECAGSPFGERWESWKTDFFSPASPLLAAAPWVFVRGNHESCSRAGDGWFRFLDPRPFPKACQSITDPYRIEIPGLFLSVVDSAEAGSTGPALASLMKMPHGNGSEWLLVHRPFLAPSAEEAKQTVNWPADLENRYSFVLSGHIHVFGASRFSDNRPPELMAGNSGALLTPGPFPFEKNPKISSKFYRDFGFLTIDKESNGRWQMISRDVKGNPKVSCQLRERLGKKSRLRCEMAK